MPSANASSSGPPFPKWQIAAVALGATGAIGLGYWYLKRQQQPVQPKARDMGSSLDETVPEEEPEPATPLELAQKYKNDGNALFKKGKYDEAISLYNKAIEVCPETHKNDLATFYQNRAAAYEQLKKWSAVIGDCTKALTLNHNYEKALYRRAKARETVKDWENCLDDITAVCLLQNFQNQNPLLMADRVLKELGKQHAAEAVKTREMTLPSKQFIKTYFMSFSEDPVYKELLDSEDPANKNTGFMKAKRAFSEENFEDVIPACTEEINSSESESQHIMEALSLRAAFYLISGAHCEALQDLKTIIETADADPKIKINALIKRASLKMQTEDTEGCLKDFEKAVEIDENVSDIYHHRGQVYLLMDKIEEARSDFQKAVEMNPKFPIAVVQKCYAEYRYATMRQNYELLAECLRQFEEVTERFPKCCEVFVLYAQVLTERQEFEKAEDLYLRAAEIDPENSTLRVHRGLLHLQWKGDVEKAVQLMKEAIKVDDKCEYAYETLGTVEVQRGNLVIAIDLFNKAIKLARTEMEMVHLFSLRDAAVSQLKVTTNLGIGPQLLKAGSS